MIVEKNKFSELKNWTKLYYSVRLTKIMNLAKWTLMSQCITIKKKLLSSKNKNEF
jgi:hypothetical protein